MLAGDGIHFQERAYVDAKKSLAWSKTGICSPEGPSRIIVALDCRPCRQRRPVRPKGDIGAVSVLAELSPWPAVWPLWKLRETCDPNWGACTERGDAWLALCMPGPSCAASPRLPLGRIRTRAACRDDPIRVVVTVHVGNCAARRTVPAY